MSKWTGGEHILTIKEVAGYLKVKERTIYRLSQAKKIPAFKVGGMWRYLRVDIDRWIKQLSMDAPDTGREEENTAKSQLNDGERK